MLQSLLSFIFAPGNHFPWSCMLAIDSEVPVKEKAKLGAAIAYLYITL